MSSQNDNEKRSGEKSQQKTKKKEKPAKLEDVQIDMDFRDPYDLNPHVRTRFEEVIGEPLGAHSDAVIWRNVNKAFHVGRSCCFGCLTYICAVPLVFLWGCNFACITFLHIYSITPCFRVFWINCECASKFFATTIHCFCDPLYEAASLIFTKIFINFNQNKEVFQEKTYAGSNLLPQRDKFPPKQMRIRREEEGKQVITDSNLTYEDSQGSISDEEMYENM